MFRCGHCIKFAPEFVEASELLKTVAPTVTLLEVGILYWVIEYHRINPDKNKIYFSDKWLFRAILIMLTFVLKTDDDALIYILRELWH